MIIGKILDSMTFIALFVYGAWHLCQNNVYEGCALLCTAVFWQRAWKADMLQYFDNKASIKAIKEEAGV